MNLPSPQFGFALAVCLAMTGCERRKPPIPNDFPKPSGRGPNGSMESRMSFPSYTGQSAGFFSSSWRGPKNSR